MKQCPRCLNKDPSLFSIRNDEIYCRACISLLGKLYEPEDSINVVDSLIDWNFELTPPQKEISTQLVQYGLVSNCLVEAVCGAGKTEIVLELVSHALKLGKKVGWMVARRQVVLQLHERLSSLFKEMKVIAVTGGYTSELAGDLVVLTAHQLYRYPHYFDLLIIDEPDAFPYKGSELLAGLCEVSCIGTRVYLTATPDKELLSLVDIHLKLDSRPHGRPLVVPTVKKCFQDFSLIYLWYYLNRMKPCLIFVPTIEEANKLGKILKIDVVTSKSIDKDIKIKRLLDKEIDVLICTTILERGVTFKGISVIVYHANHPLFDEASLVQISGRVDRSFDYQGGECVFLSFGLNKSIQECIKRLNQHNQNAFGV